VIVLAVATIDGPEARGHAELVKAADGTVTVEIVDFWVAPGAPDVRLFVSPNPTGTVDETAIDLGPVPNQQATLSYPLPPNANPNALESIIVYCTVYSVLFGAGTLAAHQESDN
jgi:hypothetical protein